MKLARCPFCGYTPDAEDPDELFALPVDGQLLWKVLCMCAATSLGHTRDEAIERWNQRAEKVASGWKGRTS